MIKLYVSLILGLMAFSVLIRGYRHSLNQGFAATCIGLIVWNTFYFLKDLFIGQQALTIIISRIFFIGPLLAGYGIAFISGVYPNNILKRKSRALLHWFFWIVSCIILCTPLVVTDVLWLGPLHAKSRTIYGPLHPFYGLAVLGLLITFALLMIKQKRRAFDIQIPQIRLMAIIVSISALCGFYTNFILPLLGSRTLADIGPALAAGVLGLGFFLLLIRYQLITLPIFTPKLIYSATYCLLVYFILTIPPLQALDQQLTYNELFIILFITLILFHPGQILFEFGLKQIFLRQRTQEQHQELSRSLSKHFEQILSGEQLREVLKKVIPETFETDQYSLLSSATPLTIHHAAHENVVLPAINKLNKSIFNVYTANGTIKRRMLQNNVRILIPVYQSKDFHITMVIGPRQDMRLYTAQDFDLAKTIQSQTAIALETIAIFEKYQKQQIQLFQAGKLATIGQTASSIAHEIKNHLAGTLLCVTQVQSLSEHPEQSALTQTFLKKAEQHIIDLQEYVKNMLDFTKRTELTRSNYIVHDIIENAKHFIQTQLTEKQITFVTGEGSEIIISCDGRKIQQVLLNLFLNAIAAMQPGGTLHISAKQDTQYRYVSIQDTGKGISPESLKLIFDPFYTTGGTGIGLSISQEIMKLHQGEILVESIVGTGTTFTLRFPNN